MIRRQCELLGIARSGMVSRPFSGSDASCRMLWPEDFIANMFELSFRNTQG
jgi:hypothetical protein